MQIGKKLATRSWMEEILHAASSWQEIAQNMGISKKEIDMIEPAFTSVR